MSTRLKRSHLLAFFAALAALAFAGCNTIEGIGEDLQSAGRAVEDAADR